MGKKKGSERSYGTLSKVLLLNLGFYKCNILQVFGSGAFQVSMGDKVNVYRTLEILCIKILCQKK